VVAIANFVVSVDGHEVFVHDGDRLRATHKVVKAASHIFEAVDPD
jgi:hypothetical protein